jgi:transposase
MDVICRGHATRQLRGVPIGRKPVWIEIDIPRVHCKDCTVTRQVEIPFADRRVSYTHAFKRYVLNLLRFATIKDVADHLGISWDVVKGIQKRHLQEHYSKPKLKHLKHLAIDEIALAKGYRFLTIVMDLASGAVVHVGSGKGENALIPFWKRLRASRARIEAVATDLSPAYISAVVKNLPEATLVFDRFHLIKLYNEKLSQLRRDLHCQLTDTMQKNSLKGVRWLLLKRPANLDAGRNEPERLAEALRLNEPLAAAYYLKEELNQIWEQEDKEAARALLMDWITYAESTGIRVLHQFARVLQLYASGILAYYDYPISTGPLEGLNNKIKTMKRQSYGFRDPEFFKLKIYAIHECKYALVG